MESLDLLLRGPLAMVQPAIQSAFTNRAQHCYHRNLYDEQRFATCMQRTTEDVERQEALLRHRLLFVGLKFDECILTRDRNVCEMEGRDHGVAAINHFIKNIERY